MAPSVTRQGAVTNVTFIPAITPRASGQDRTMLLLLCSVAIIVTHPIPLVPDPPSQPTPPYIFRGLNCFGKNNAEVTSFYGSAPSDCQHADIFLQPEEKPAQIITVADFHPIQAVHCSVKVKATTASCGISKSINMRKHYLFNKEILNTEFSPPPKECFESYKTGQLTWIIPPLGNYPGETLTSQLTDGRVVGTHYAYNQVPGQYSCTGFTWLDSRNLAHLNAAIQIDFKIIVRTIWLQYNINQNTLVAPD